MSFGTARVRVQAEFEIDEELVQLLAQVTDPGPVLHDALQALADEVRETWGEVALRSGIRSGTYRDSIQPPELERLGSTSSAIIVGMTIENTWPVAVFFEDGRAAFHLPSRIDWSGPKVKRTKKGTPYMHIPFGHRPFATEKEMTRAGYTTATRKQLMPADITAAAKNLRPREPLKAGPQYDAQGQYLQADLYRWGGRPGQPTRLPEGTGDGPIVIGPDGKPQNRNDRRGPTQVAGRIRGRPITNPGWVSSRYSGLFKTGGQGHEHYMTIRTITPNSQGWNIPAMPGLGIARKVSADLRANAQNDFDDLLLKALGG